MVEASKTCSKCKEALPLSSFTKDKIRKDGLNYRCGNCTKEDHRIDYIKHTERRKATVKVYNKAIKKELFDYYGRKCKCCGETENAFLSIDHVNNDGAEHKRKLGGERGTSGTIIYKSIINQGFPNTFQVLCFNCNWAKSHGGCPHQNTSNTETTQS